MLDPHPRLGSLSLPTAPRRADKPRPRRGAARLAVVVLAVLACLSTVVVPVRAVAAGTVDLIVQMSVPATAGAGSAFEATMTITNRGADAATDVGVSLAMDAGTTSIVATPGTATSGASPAEQLTVSGTTVSGTIPTLPPLGTVTVVVTGRYPVASSAAFQATATAGPADTELDPSTNSVTQNTALDRGASVSVSKTQDLATVASGQTRTYTVTYTNTGAIDITGLRLTDYYTLGAAQTGTTYSVSCAPSSTAPCPSWANGTTRTSTNSTVVYMYSDGTADLPVGTSLVLTIPITTTMACLPTGTTTATNYTNFTAPADVQLAPGATSARVTGNLTAPVCPTASVSVSKTQDLATVASGQTRTYTVTYTNTGAIDITGLRLTDYYTLGAAQTGTTYSVSCAPSSTAPCPSWANGTTRTSTNSTVVYMYSDGTADLPVGTSLVLTIPITTTMACLPTGTTTATNYTNFTAPADVQLAPGATSARVTGNLTAPVCPTASVSVSKTQDLATVASGQTRTYTVTYTNTGAIDITGLRLTDYYTLGAAQTGTTYSVSCAPSSTAPCPSWANGTTRTSTNSTVVYMYSDGTADLPVGTSLVLTIPITTTMACLPTGTTTATNYTNVVAPTGIQLAPGATSARVTGSLRTTDITTTTRVSTSSPEPGEELTVSSEISNRCGATTNVPVTITLPEGGLTVADGATPVCTAAGGATCPTDLLYDPASHTVTGTVPSVPAGGSVVISLTGRAGVIQSLGSSQLVTTSAPDPWDLTPTTNTSSTTYAYRNTRTDVTVIHRVEGLPATGAPESMTFTGTLSCQASGTHPVSVTIPAGSTEARTTVLAAVWLKDTCTITVEHPEAPTGLSWVTGTQASVTESTGEVSAPVERRYTWVLTDQPQSFPLVPPLPLTGGTPADTLTIVGAGMVFLALVLAALRRRAPHRDRD
ncbi:MAG: hypothetical protein Q4C85_01425 [Actinomyces sp.]|uniref:hypothetical protein n=1 Tax=Actinomyces sp. TaxID=29317 RepID=UPI0026DB14FF|nr:hypothetical protein [Actinomyces sp.]MDO4242423.1 hypothetical protein [Actinomyces sp.]